MEISETSNGPAMIFGFRECRANIVRSRQQIVQERKTTHMAWCWCILQFCMLTIIDALIPSPHTWVFFIASLYF